MTDSRAAEQERGGRWCFGRGELDESCLQLTVAGQVHELDRSSLELLRCLLRHAGDVVLKETLVQAGWPGRLVSENSLTKAVSRLRHALDDPEGKLLVTVHGYGYRLAAQVHFIPAPVSSEALPPISTAADSPTTLDSPAPTAPRQSRRRLGLLLAALALTLLFYWRPWGKTDAPPETTGTAAVAGPASIAVLPFLDLSQAHDQQYFSDGLADELLDQLAGLPNLRVAGRTSSFAFRGKDDDVLSIGRKLGVATVLEGSVRKSGERIRITVQLINVADGFHLWSQTYDRRLTDLFEVQDDIARSVVAALRLHLLPDQEALVTRHRTSNAEAYNQFLLGQQLRRNGRADDDRRAIAAYEQAIVLDPGFATAYAALADLLGGDAEYADTPAEFTAGKLRSLAMLDKAIALDPTLAQSYVARADLRLSTAWDWAGAQRDLDRSAALQPGENLSRAINQCRLLVARGRVPEAIAIEQSLVRSNPTSSAWGPLGYHLAAIGRFEEARHALAQAYKLFPSDNRVNFYLGVQELLQSRPEPAIAAFERSGGAFRLAGLAMAQHSAGRPGPSQLALDTLIRKSATTSAWQIAEVYAWRGERDQAFDWIERAYQQRDAGLIYIRFDPLLANLRGDPRYRNWLQKLHLPD